MGKDDLGTVVTLSPERSVVKETEIGYYYVSTPSNLVACGKG